MSGVLLRLLALQGAITTVCAIVLLAWRGADSGLAGMAGGATASASAIAYGLGYWLLGRKSGESPLRAFLVCEALRMGTALGLLVIGIGLFSGPDALAYLSVFAAAMMAYLLVWVV